MKRTAHRRVSVRTDGTHEVWREENSVYLKVPCGVFASHTFELTRAEARELAAALEEAALAMDRS